MNTSVIDFSQRSSINARVFWFLLAILLPLALAALWHQINTVIPNDDSGNYFETAVRIHRQFEHGLVNGIVASYQIRGWRPIFFPVLAVPFIAITAENILHSVALTMLFLYCFFLIYVFLIARQILPPELACLVTLFIAEISWVFQSAQYFMSELAMVLCALGAVYHFKRSNFLRAPGATILTGLWIALGLMIRPVEFSLSLVIPVVVVLIWAVEIQALTKNDLFMCSAFSLMAVTLLAAQVVFPTFLPVWLVLWVFLIVLNLGCVLGFETLKLSLPFGVAFFLCHLLSTGWWLPQMRNFYEWVHLTTGDMAANYHNQGEMNTVRAIEAFFVNLGGYPLIAGSVVFISGILPKRKTDPSIYKQFTGGLALAVGMILPPVIALSLTPDIAYRRGFIGFCMLLMVTCTLALHPRLSRPRLRVTLFCSWILVQFFMASLFTFDLFPSLRGRLALYWGYVGIPMVGGDPSLRTFEKLKEFHLEGAGVAVLTHSLQDFAERPFDTPGLTLAALKQRNTISFGYPVQFANLEEGYKQLLAYDYVLLDVSSRFPLLPQGDTPYTRLTEDLIQKWNKGELEKIGFESVTEFEVSRARPIHEPDKKKKIVLFMTQRPGSPQFSMKDNIALARYGSVPGSTSPDGNGFPISNLNDGNESTAWGSAEVSSDTIFYITHPTPFRARAFKIVLFTMPNGGHIRDLSVVATNKPADGNTSWRLIRSRISADEPFREKITIPPAPDRTVVTIEIDMSDPNWMVYKTWGLACFSKSRGYKRNYVAVGNGIYVREFQIASVGAAQ